MSKKRIFSLFIIVIILILIFASALIWFSKSSFEKTIILKSENYTENWKYRYTVIDDTQKIVKVYFEIRPLAGGWQDKAEDMRKIYFWLSEKLFAESALSEYSLNVDFTYEAVGQYFQISNTVYDLEIRLRNNMNIKEISKVFPDVDCLELSGSTIFEDASGFNNISYLYVNYLLNEEEIDVIKSYHPNCVIEFRDNMKNS